MTKQKANYSNAIIYKLCCKDTEIKEIYIGSTTNFRNRKYQHKTSCMNENDKNYFTYKYKFIRQNGGFYNWDMIQIEQYSAVDKRDLEQFERLYIDILEPELNRQNPFTSESEKQERIKEYQKQNRINKKQHKKIA